jgi:hypothetical protein
MVASTSGPESYADGHPRSSDADLDPGPDVRESLEDADRVASDEHRVVAEHRRSGGSTNDQDGVEESMTSTMPRLGPSQP